MQKCSNSSMLQAASVAGRINPSAMTAEQLAAVLRGGGAGGAATAEAIARHQATGAPANADGTVNLVHYTAWLIRQIEQTDAR